MDIKQRKFQFRYLNIYICKQINIIKHTAFYIQNYKDYIINGPFYKTKRKDFYKEINSMAIVWGNLEFIGFKIIINAWAKFYSFPCFSWENDLFLKYKSEKEALLGAFPLWSREQASFTCSKLLW